MVFEDIRQQRGKMEQIRDQNHRRGQLWKMNHTMLQATSGLVLSTACHEVARNLKQKNNKRTGKNKKETKTSEILTWSRQNREKRNMARLSPRHQTKVRSACNESACWTERCDNVCSLFTWANTAWYEKQQKNLWGNDVNGTLASTYHRKNYSVNKKQRNKCHCLYCIPITNMTFFLFINGVLQSHLFYLRNQ